MIYILSENDYNSINSQLPDDVYVGYICDNGNHLTSTDHIDRLKLAYDMDTIFTNLFGSTNLDDFASPESELYIKIYRYIEANSKYELFDPPKGHDYIRGLTTNLHAKRTFNQGELIKVEWYADKEFTDLVINVDIVYTRDAVGFAEERITTRTWYREDGTAHPDTKVTTKVYSSDTLSQTKEGIKRRGNIVEGIQMPVLGMMLATVPAKSGELEEERQARVIKLGRLFLSQHKTGFQLFKEDSNRAVTSEIEESADFWLDNIIDGNGTTIRQYILLQFDIGGIE